MEGSDLGTTEDPFEPTASCINDTKKRQLVTRSGLSRLRCCLCHLHHKWAMNSSAVVREFLRTVLQQVCHFKVDIIAEMPTPQHARTTKNKNTMICTIPQLPCCQERCNERSIRVKTTPQMTRFRDAKVCNNLVTDEKLTITEYSLTTSAQLDYKIQRERTLHLVLRLRGETERQDARHQ